MQQHPGDGHGQYRVTLELDCRAIGQQHRQEEESRIGNGVQQMIGRAGGVYRPGQFEDRQQRLNHPRAGDRRDHRGKGGRDHTDNL
ncbi:hypothetical protein D3C78_1516120 [compost metagenome]